MFCHFPVWCPGSGVVLDYIDSWPFPSSLLSWKNNIEPLDMVILRKHGVAICNAILGVGLIKPVVG